MAKILLAAIFIVCSTLSFSQISFEKGYFINDDGSRTDCLIKNVDWLASPKEFNYTLSQGSPVQKAHLGDVKEFGVGDTKYIKSAVKIDYTSNETKNLTYNSGPEWVTDTVFLKVLVEGKANLYYYRFKGYDRFFFNVGQSQINQLIYKRYRLRRHDIEYTVENNTFQNQLFTEVNCRSYPIARLNKFKYNTGTLTDFFIQNNECSGESQTKVGFDTTRTLFRIKLAPGLDYAQQKIEYSDGTLVVKFDQQAQFRFGAEFELILPLNRNKWAVIVEPTYQAFKATSKDRRTKIDYQSIEVPIGIRYYAFLNKTTSIFINGQAVFDLGLKYEVTSKNFNIDAGGPGLATAFGAGFAYKRFTLEAIYYPTRTAHKLYWLDYQKSSLIVGYRIFN